MVCVMMQIPSVGISFAMTTKYTIICKLTNWLFLVELLFVIFPFIEWEIYILLDWGNGFIKPFILTLPVKRPLHGLVLKLGVQHDPKIGFNVRWGFYDESSADYVSIVEYIHVHTNARMDKSIIDVWLHDLYPWKQATHILKNDAVVINLLIFCTVLRRMSRVRNIEYSMRYRPIKLI